MSKKKTEEIKSEKEKSSRKTYTDQTQPKQPILLEFGQIIWRIIILVSGFTTAFISYFKGCEIVIAMIRGSLTVFILGLIGWLMNWLLIRHSLDVVRLQIQKTIEESEKHTFNKMA